jgi:hypothetical protein
LQAPLVRGRVAVARSDHDRAVEIADAVFDRWDRGGIRTFIADALSLKGSALAAAGRAPAAESVLRERG